MAADGSIIIDTKIDEEGFEAGTKELEAAARRMANSLSDLGDKAKIALQKQVDSFAKLNNQYSQQAKKVDELKQKISEYENQKLPTQEYVDIQRQIETAQSKLDSLMRKQEKFLEMGGSTKSNTYKSMQYDIEELINTIQYAKGEMTEIESSGKAFTYGGNTESVQRDLEKLVQEEAKLNDINNRLETSYASLKQKVSQYKQEVLSSSDAQKITSKSGVALNKSLKETEKGSKNARMGLGRMLATSLLFSTVFRALSAVTNGIKEGMGNLAQYSGETNATLSSLMSSLTQLKNAFATAFSPILTVVAPALNYLIGLLTSAATAVAQLISVLTGKNSFVKATKVQQDYAESLEKTGGAAKEAEGALAAFDKLNVSQDNSGGGGSGGELSPEEMFETVPVDNSLTQAIDMIKQKWLELSDLFKKGFAEGIGDLSVLDSIKDSISSIKSSLLDIFTDNSVTAAFQKMVDTLVYNAGRIAGSFVSVGLTIADNILGGFSKFLNQNKDRIKSYLIAMFDIASSISTIQANFAVAVADIFTVFRSDTAKQVTADIISIFSNAFMGINELVGKLFRDVINLILTPFTENADAIKDALNNTLAPVEEVLGTIANSVANTFDAFNRMYDEHLAPLFESLKDGLSDILTSLLDGYNKYIAPVLDKISKRFTEVWEGTIQPLIENAIGLIGDVADLIKTVWENILQPVVNWFVSNMYPVIAPIVEDLASIFLTNFEDIGNIFNDFMDAARAVIQFITYIFSVDWNSAWEGIKKSFKETFESLPGIVKGVIEKVISSVETMVNGVIRSINSLSFDIPDWVPKIGGQTFGFQLDEVHLPRLASGTVVPPRAGEFAAILGDNPKEPEVVSPLSTMKQALKEAMLEVNGAGGGDIHLTVNLEGKAIYDTVVKRNRMEKNRTGSNPLLA